MVLAAPLLAEPPILTITSPEAGVPIFGETDFRVEVLEGDVVSVRFLVDGEEVGISEGPDFGVQVDVGEENLSHRFEAIATAADGQKSSSLLVSPAIQVDEEVQAELRQLYVTVTQNDKRVLSLEQEDFRVHDNRLWQRIVTFGRGDVRLTATLLVDSSTSMKGRRLRYALRGAETFLKGLKPVDDASMILFSDHLVKATPFSNNVDELMSRLSGTEAEGGTALNDHLYVALKKLENRQGRRVVIILSDGIDSHSVLRMSDVQWIAQRSRALIYWIRIHPGGSDPTQRLSAWKNPEIYKEEYRLLTRTVEGSGGRIVDLKQLKDAQSAFQEILDELREQYVLGYYPSISNKDGSFHRVEVKIDRPDMKVRTLKGYVDH